MSQRVEHNRTAGVVSRMRGALRGLARPARSGVDSVSTVRRLEVSLDTIDPLLWLAAQPGAPKFYWRDRDGCRQSACVGAAAAFSSDLANGAAETLASAARTLDRAHPDLRAYGGFRFDPNYPQNKRDSRWRGFRAAGLALPRFELVTDKDGSRMYCNLFKSEIDTDAVSGVLSELGKLRFEEPDGDISVPGLCKRKDMPERIQWERQVAQALELFQSTDIKKLVLARRTSLRLTSRINPWHVLDRLRESADNCYLFGVQLADAGVFIGASPERLYRREGDVIETEAIAGTRPRASDRKEDGRLGGELAASDKDQDEHGIVVTGIGEALAGLCERFESTESSETLKLAAVQHLQTLFSGRLKPGVSDPSILPALHPSAAVGGYPREQAMQSLRQIEAFDRGWYAGPIGWLGAAGAEFAVGIRSALVHDDCMDLFAGAGIVRGSSADAEWDEIESKMSPYLHLFESETK